VHVPLFKEENVLAVGDRIGCAGMDWIHLAHVGTCKWACLDVIKEVQVLQLADRTSNNDADRLVPQS